MQKLSFYLISIIFLLSFNIGLLSILGIEETYTRLLIDFLILMLFLCTLNKIKLNEFKIEIPNFMILIIGILVILISYLINETSITQLMIFFRKIFIPYLFFYSIINLYINVLYIEKIIKLIKQLFIIQIIATFIKILIVGPMEPYIGTIGVLGGSLAAIMPLFAIVYLIIDFFYSKKSINLILIILFTVIGLASLKIAIIFYLAILFISLLIISSYKINNKIFDIFNVVKYSVFLIFAGSIILTLFITLNPRLNPENKIGGSIDFNHISKYIDMYNNADSLSYAKSTGTKGQGRSDAHGAIYNLLINKGIDKLVFGLGPGDIIKSNFNNYEDPLLDKYKIGYGGRIGYLWLSMQIGYLGSFIFLLFHYRLLIPIKNLPSSNNEQYNKYKLMIYGFSIIFFMDTLTYSHVLLLDHAAILTYLFLFSIFPYIKNNEIKI
jgi:hypothetical protein